MYRASVTNVDARKVGDLMGAEDEYPCRFAGMAMILDDSLDRDGEMILLTALKSCLPNLLHVAGKISRDANCV